MSLRDKLSGVLPPYLEIFRPLVSCRNKSVFIATWSLTDPIAMGPILNSLMLARKVELLVGYSKSFHVAANLAEIVKFYKYDLKWDVRVLPNCHCKVWTVGNKAWVGSCNFVPGTCYNLMAQVSFGRVERVVRQYWRESTAVSKTTNLALVPQVRSTGIAQVI